MSRIGNVANATLVMMETNQLAASSSDNVAAERAERELDQRRAAVAEKLAASESGILGGILSGIVGLIGAVSGIAGNLLGWVGQANAAAGVASSSIDVAATVCNVASPVAAASAEFVKAPFSLDSAQQGAQASVTELEAEQETRARERAERRAERAREDNRQAATTLLEQLAEYNNARKFV